MDCHHCGARLVEHIAWLDRRNHFTRRLWAWVEALTQLLPIAHVAQLTGLHGHTIKTMDHQRQHGKSAAGDVKRLVMGEFALRHWTEYQMEAALRFVKALVLA